MHLHGPDDAPLPQCVICKELLANDTMRPFKLQRHIETKQPSLVTEPPDFLDGKLKELRPQKKESETLSTVNTTETQASHVVVLRIAEAGKATTSVNRDSSLLLKIRVQ